MTEAVGTEPIVKEVSIDASPETVFAFFTEPDKLARWMCREATVDPRPGGINHQTHISDRDGKAYHLRSKFLEVVPPSRVVFSWEWEESSERELGANSTVEVTFRPDGNGTLVRLVHRAVVDELRADHEAGWTTLLARLPAAVAG